MKFILRLFIVSVLLLPVGSFSVLASGISMANDCLSYGKRVMKDNPEMINLLGQVKISGDNIQVNNYSQMLGKQFISRELVAIVNNGQERSGSILCLYESDNKPLYFHLTLMH